MANATTIQDWMRNKPCVPGTRRVDKSGTDYCFLRAMDVLRAILAVDDATDFRKTEKYKGNMTFVKCHRYFSELREALGNKLPDTTNHDAADMVSTRPVRRWRSRHADNGAEIDVGEYVSRSDKFFIDEYRQTKQKPGLSVIIPMDVPYSMRDMGYMAERQAVVYARACAAYEENRPCRVVAVTGDNFVKHPDIYSAFLIKDYNEPLYKSIWAFLRNNRTSNSFVNCFLLALCGGEGHGLARVARRYPLWFLEADEEYEIIDTGSNLLSFYRP